MTYCSKPLPPRTSPCGAVASVPRFTRRDVLILAAGKWDLRRPCQRSWLPRVAPKRPIPAIMSWPATC